MALVVRVTLSVGVTVALVACAGCKSPAPTVEPGTPVVLISIDTLRSDRLPVYGYQGVATPAIDRLASDGVVFDSAFSHSPLTLPSHVSILTGLLPGEHRVRDNVGYPLDSASTPLLQRALQASGYRTGGFVSSFVLRRDSGLANGFDAYDDGIELTAAASLASLQRPGGETLERASAWLDTVAADPFLLFFHVYEPHSPYTPPEPFASRFASPYDGEVAAADDIVGRLFDRLDALGLYDRSLILLFSDHGEGLGQHGEQEHGVFLYRTTLQVPLILKLPGSTYGGSRSGSTVQLADLAPTVVDLLGLEPEPRHIGRPLLTALDGSVEERPVYSETFYPRLHFGWSALFSVVDGRHHFIDAPEPELYDLVDDPDETNNIVGSRPDLQDGFAAELELYERTLDDPEAVSAETLRRLAALGYIGSAATTDDEDLPDPKGQIGSLADLRRATALFEQRRFDKAIPVLQALIADQPRIVEAWDYLARSLENQGRTGEALEVYENALSRFPGTPLLSLSAARFFFNLGMLDHAAPLAEVAVDVDTAAAESLLSRIALRRGDVDEAERRASRAREHRDSRLAPDLAWADVLIARERFEDALESLDGLEAGIAASAERDPELWRGVSFLRGKALARMGRAAEAEEAFMKEIERFPLDPQSYTHLALMYGLVGMQSEALVVITRLLRVNGSPYAIGESIKTLDLIGARQQADQLVRQGLSRHPDDPGLGAVIDERRGS